ncbi:hypothetical protein OPV22_019775 [Ensete ventricosum]|uniref:Uncharacterized protein n=1 Tax=Ensete ventricosum TaxID=4639 RepID=A0AAV8QIN3_ENSVE|nr:hypothetical protein OPV22_019775 [Ensete ventricosum]
MLFVIVEKDGEGRPQRRWRAYAGVTLYFNHRGGADASDRSHRCQGDLRSTDDEPTVESLQLCHPRPNIVVEERLVYVVASPRRKPGLKGRGEHRLGKGRRSLVNSCCLVRVSWSPSVCHHPVDVPVPFQVHPPT